MLDGVFGGGTGAEFFLDAGNIELLGGFPLVCFHREVTRAGGAFVDDPFAAQRNDGNENDDKAETGIVGRQLDGPPAMRARPGPAMEDFLSMVMCSYSVNGGRHEKSSGVVSRDYLNRPNQLNWVSRESWVGESKSGASKFIEQLNAELFSTALPSLRDSLRIM